MQVNFTGTQTLPTKRMVKPTSFSGTVSTQQPVSFTGVDYGKIGQSIKDAAGKIDFKGFFGRIREFLTQLPEKLKPVNDFLSNMFKKLWELVRPISTKAP